MRLLRILEFAALLLAVFLLRLPVYFDSVVDWDESIYLLVAEDVLRGHLPYSATFDHKPPVIYYAFAGARWVFGEGVESIRWLGALCVAVSGYSLWRIACQTGLSPWSGAAAAACFSISCVANGGLATNAELVMMAFVHCGAALLGAARNRAGSARSVRCVASGVLFAFGFGTKFVVAFDIAGALVLHALTLDASNGRERIRRAAAALPPLGLGFALGSAVWLAPHALAGELQRMKQVVLDFNLQYAASGADVTRTAAWFAGLRPFAGVVALCAALGWLGRGAAPSPPRRGVIAASMAWTALALGEVALTGRYHGHYFLVVGAPLALLVAALSEPVFTELARTRGVRLAAAGTILACAFLAGPALDYKWPAVRFARSVRAGDLALYDVPRQVARRLSAELADDDRIYVYNYEHVLYHLLQRRSPTPYAFSDLLNDPRYPIEWLGVDRQAEVARVLAERPEWVVVHERPQMRGYPTIEVLEAELAVHYEPVHRHAIPFRDESVVSYRLRAR